MDLIEKYAHPYQKKAIQFTLDNKSVFLALDMGLGKTLISLAVIQKTGLSAVVFAPLKPLYNTWPKEIKKWTPGLTYDIIHGPNKSSTLMRSTADIWLINYDSIKWFYNNVRSLVKRWQKRTLVIDESSMVKSHRTQRFKMLKKMHLLWNDYKMCLSATPAPNGYYELWTQYYLLDKGKTLDTAYTRFRDTYFIYTGPPRFQTIIKHGAEKEITRLIKPKTYRLEANDYLKMPKTINNFIELEMPKELQSRYKQLEDDFLLEFSDETSVTARSAAILGMKLRQFIQGALYLDDTNGQYKEFHKIKIEYLKEVLESAAGNPILCPINFKFEYAMIKKYISKDVPIIAGGVSTHRSNYLIDEWNKGKLPLLLCHPASISHGTNLQAGGHILLWMCIPWSLEQYQQLNGRLIRQGQKNASVTVNHLVMKNTRDKRVIEVLNRKDATQSALLQALKR